MNAAIASGIMMGLTDEVNELIMLNAATRSWKSWGQSMVIHKAVAAVYVTIHRFRLETQSFCLETMVSIWKQSFHL